MNAAALCSRLTAEARDRHGMAVDVAVELGADGVLRLTAPRIDPWTLAPTGRRTLGYVGLPKEGVRRLRRALADLCRQF